MRNSIMKTIEVAAAVIVDSFENTTEVFATERGYGEFKGCLLYTSDAADE